MNTKKERILNRYKNNVIRLNRLKDKLQTIVDSLDVKSIRYSDMPRGYGNLSPSDLMVEKLDLEERIEKLETLNHNMKIKILYAIEKLENDKHAAAIEMFYIDNLNKMDISDKLNCGLTTVKRYLKRGIDNIRLEDLE